MTTAENLADGWSRNAFGTWRLGVERANGVDAGYPLAHKIKPISHVGKQVQ